MLLMMHGSFSYIWLLLMHGTWLIMMVMDAVAWQHDFSCMLAPHASCSSSSMMHQQIVSSCIVIAPLILSWLMAPHAYMLHYAWLLTSHAPHAWNAQPQSQSSGSLASGIMMHGFSLLTILLLNVSQNGCHAPCTFLFWSSFTSSSCIMAPHDLML